MKKQLMIFVVLMILCQYKVLSQKYIDTFYVAKRQVVIDVINRVKDSVMVDIKTTHCLINTQYRIVKLLHGFAYNGIEFQAPSYDTKLLNDLKSAMKKYDVKVNEYNIKELFRASSFGVSEVWNLDTIGNKSKACIYLEINSPLESWENLEVLHEATKAGGDIHMPSINEIFSKKLSLPVYVMINNDGVISRENRIYMYEFSEDKKFKFIQMIKY
jgi:hypothetical protein